jgi:CDGSH-type Zn-finger protein
MADVSIKVNDNGPYVVRGLEVLEDGEGNRLEAGAAIALCRCGHSANKPFCDGAHKANDFSNETRAGS